MQRGISKSTHEADDINDKTVSQQDRRTRLYLSDEVGVQQPVFLSLGVFERKVPASNQVGRQGRLHHSFTLASIQMIAMGRDCV